MQHNPSCRKCPLWEGNHSVCIKARGSDHPKVLFVGDAPGGHEDLAGKPFVGPAGQLLQQALNAYKIEDYRLTHVVRCRSLDGKKPKSAEIAACADYLRAEVEATKPNFIVALGAVPLLALTGKPKITEWAGQITGAYMGVPVFAMLHPSHILHDDRQLPRFENSFKELIYLLRPKSKPVHPKVFQYSPVEARTQLHYWMQAKVPVAWDYETTDKSPFNGNSVRSVAFSDGDLAFWLNVEAWGAQAQAVIVEFLSSTTPKIAFNAYFEFLWSLVHFGVAPRNLGSDPMLKHYLIDENKPHGLDQVAAEYLGAPNWDIHGTMVANNWTYATIPVEKIGPYNALDALYTARLDPLLSAKLGAQKWTYDEVLLPLTKTCARMTKRGIRIDAAWAKKVIEKYRGDMAVVAKEFTAAPAVQVIVKEQKKIFNINSAKQIGHLFYDKLRLPVAGYTERGKLLLKAGERELANKIGRSVGEKVIETLKSRHPLVAKYIDWKKKKTVITNYLEKFPLFCDKQGRIHPEYKTSFVVTGRLSCAEPPAHSFPKPKLVKGMVYSRYAGGKILSADYKQLEVRLAVNEAGETDLIEAIKKGLDVHDETAKRMYGAQWVVDYAGKNGPAAKEAAAALRTRAKQFNFGVLYGMTEYKIKNDWHIPIEEAKQYLDNYWKSRPLLALWMRKVHAKLEEFGFVESRFGRRRHLNLAGMTEKERGHALRQAGNFPIQSTGADICNLAAITMDSRMRALGLKSCLIHSIHDSLIIDVHPKEEKQVRELCVSVMEREIPGRLGWLKVPLAVDVEVSPRWGGAEKVA